MSEQSLPAEERNALCSIVQKKLLSCKPDADFSRENSLDPNSDLSNIIELALIARTLNCNTESWNEQVVLRRDRQKNDAFERMDTIAAIEADEKYIRYLLNIQKVDEAILLAKSLTNGYTAPSTNSSQNNDPLGLVEFSARLIQRELYVKPLIAQRDITRWLLEHENLEKAKEVAERPGMELYADSIADGLLRYYGSHKQNAHILTIIDSATQMRELSTGFEKNKWNAVVNRGYQMLAHVAFVDDDLDTAFRELHQISIRSVRLSTLLTEVEHCVEVGDSGRIARISEELFQQIASEDIGAGVSGANNTGVGGIGPEETVEHLIRLLYSVSAFPELRQIADRSLYGFYGDESVGIFSALEQVSTDQQPRLWGELFEFAADMGVYDWLDSLFLQAKESLPHSDFLQMKYALCIARISDEPFRTYLSHIHNVRDRLHAYTDFMKIRLRYGDVREWSLYMNELLLIEDEIYSTQAFHIPTEEEIRAGADDDMSRMISSVRMGSMTTGLVEKNEHKRSSTWMMSEIAHCALMQGQWSVVEQVLMSDQLQNCYAVNIMNDVLHFIE